MATPPEDPKLAELHPPLKEFTVVMPNTRFYNYEKLSKTSKAVRQLSNEIHNFKPHNPPKSFLPSYRACVIDGEAEYEEEQPPSLDTIDSKILEHVPSLAASSCDYDLKPDREFLDLIKKQYDDRFKLSEEFRREESRVLSNYYDIQLREHMQKNESLDHRPMMDALRQISRVHVFPMDSGSQRFYKFNVRNDKMQKRHKKALDKLAQNQDLHAEWLLQRQIHEVLTYGDINKTEVENVKIPKLPIPYNE